MSGDVLLALAPRGAGVRPEFMQTVRVCLKNNIQHDQPLKTAAKLSSSAKVCSVSVLCEQQQEETWYLLEAYQQALQLATYRLARNRAAQQIMLLEHAQPPATHETGSGQRADERSALRTGLLTLNSTISQVLQN